MASRYRRRRVRCGPAARSLSDCDRQGLDDPARSRQIQRAADRIWPDGADRIGPRVQQQFGMIVGIPNAGQVNALATLNIRGERSVTCRGDFDLHPSKGPLPPARRRSASIFDTCRMRLSTLPS